VTLWSELLRDDPTRLELELARAGTTLNDLARDIRDVPGFDDLTRRMSREAKQRLALQYFGDEGHAQPEQRRDWMRSKTSKRARWFRTPDFGQLPRLRDAATSEVEEEPPEKKPRHRPPEQIPKVTVQKLMLELEKRRTRPHDPELTQEKIGERLKLHRSRVQQAEALRRAGWDLLRSHPEFSADAGFVRWPSPVDAARLLESERAEN
jgi:hypothetical protein